eukprot:8394267-Ditylum_brightwellii.AAC.1
MFLLGENNGNYESVCGEGKFIKLPTLFKGECPSSMLISKEECAAAVLSVGGKIGVDGIVEGSFEEAPFGCSKHTVDDTAYYNAKMDGLNDGNYESMCHEPAFVKVHGLPKCPLESSVNQDDCVVAGLSAGGTLQTNGLNEKVVTEGSWNDKPSGCFLTKANGIVHFNSNPVGVAGNGYIPVCHEIE